MAIQGLTRQSPADTKPFGGVNAAQAPKAGTPLPTATGASTLEAAIAGIITKLSETVTALTSSKPPKPNSINVRKLSAKADSPATPRSPR